MTIDRDHKEQGFIGFIMQMLMSVLLGTIHVMIMQSVMILMVVTGVSVCQDSREMDTTVQVCFYIIKEKGCL